MSHLCKRIVRRLKYTWLSFRSDCHFSLYYAILRLADELGGRLGAHRISDCAHNKKDQWILHYLENQLRPLLHEMQDIEEPGEYVDNAPIWVCWWSGEKTAPPLVKRCIRSIREHAGQHPVNLITEENYITYLKVPDYILNKNRLKKIGLAHLADYIRVSLLEAYGGLWLDATMFVTQSLTDEYFHFPIFTCKSPRKTDSYVSEYQWVTFVLGGLPGNIFYRFLRAAFELYWKENDYAIDYLFFDYLIKIGSENIPAISAYLKAVPYNNLHRDDLQAAMNAGIPESQFSEIIKDDTCLYKLSWRESYPEYTNDGKKTIFRYFLDN